MSDAQSKAEIVRSTHGLHSVELLLVVNLGVFQDHFLHTQHMVYGKRPILSSVYFFVCVEVMALFPICPLFTLLYLYNNNMSMSSHRHLPETFVKLHHNFERLR